ncbi:MAG: class I SAM-dependent methyltransferase [Clostridioides sp.]|nr:class I SAM-dependent methyltransferase [Clostridioides sp.]
MCDKINESRFIKVCDNHSDICMVRLPDTWWSRRYEYPWAMEFVDRGDICLDAACGIEHPFKFWLAENCKQVNCLDADNRILNRSEVLSLARENCTREEYNKIEEISNKIDFKCGDITATGYPNKYFDKVFCISVLEHLPANSMFRAIKEFSRILKDDGKLILTFDYPSVDFLQLTTVMEQAGMRFLGEADFDLNDDILVSKVYEGVKCVRAVLIKNQ